MDTTFRRLVVAVLGMANLLLLTAAPAAATGPSFSAAQHNITHRWYGALRYVAEHDRPIVMTANEVCFLSLLALNDSVSQYGYGSRAAISRANSRVCPYNGENLHLLNVAYTQGLIPNAGVTLNTNHDMPGTNAQDRRMVPCARGTAYGFSWFVCSAHLAPNDYVLADQQSDWLRSAMSSALIGNGPRILGGDFNLRPRQFNPFGTDPWRGSWQESDDTCYSWNKDRRTTTGGGPGQYLCANSSTPLRAAKIDYLWASAFWFVDAFGTADIRCTVNESSDHCLLFATFRWR